MEKRHLVANVLVDGRIGGPQRRIVQVGTLLREMGFPVKNKTPLEVTDIYRDDNSGELVCKMSPDGKGEFTAALTNLKLDMNHPLYRKVKNYQIEVSEALGKQDVEDTRQTSIDQEDRGGFRVGSLYKNK